ncbi:MAG: transglycosylase domain-containing protein [Bacteroidota bacterium]|nr:transglycosylase domain-containing protein [Bacteroidota bacterium]
MKKRKQKIKIRIIRGAAILAVLPFLLTGLLFLLIYTGAFGPLPNKEKLSKINNEEASLVFSADDQLIGKYFAENRTNISWEDVPGHLKNALVATEDKRFFSHGGVDRKSYLRVLVKTIIFRDRSAGGGSTITQQLIKNLYGRRDFGYLSLPVNKLKEAIIASRMEDIYSKEEILLLYFNSVPFGEDVYGVESAARRYFNKNTNELRPEESAVLVGLLKGNTFFNPRLHPENSLQRRNLVISRMREQNYFTEQQADSLMQLPLGLNYENFGLEAPAGYFVYQVRKKAESILEEYKKSAGINYDLEKDGLHIHTTLDIRLQNAARQSIKEHLAKMQKLLDRQLASTGFRKNWYEQKRNDSSLDQQENHEREIRVFDWNPEDLQVQSKIDSIWHYYKMLHAAVLILHPDDGCVLTWIGGNHFRYLPFDMVLSHRQIASAFKPVLYASALETGIDACTYLENEEKTFEEYQGWEPHNFDYNSTPDSSVAMWYALAHSMNLPSVDLYFKLGHNKLRSTCAALQLPLPPEGIPSSALGTLDISLFEITRAYQAFANSGRIAEPWMIDRITDAEGNVIYKHISSRPAHALSKSSSETITAILQKAINEGTGAGLRGRFGIRSDLAGKTGTAQNYSDAWFMAYTPEMLIGTWVGASDPEVHFSNGNGSGAALALPISAGILELIENEPALAKLYLASFHIPYNIQLSIQCDPYKEKGIDGFLKRLFNPDDKNDRKAERKEIREARKKARQEKREKEGSGLKRFFKGLFKGKNDSTDKK